MKGKVIDSSTSNPLSWVTLRFRFLENGGGKDIVRRSAAGGGFHLKNLQPGEYKLIASFPGYVTNETVMAVSSGNLTRLVVEMEKNPVK